MEQEEKIAEAGCWRFTPTNDPTHARLRIQAAVRAPHRVPAFLTGKFCEHLGANIANGMWAQILRNPTFAEFPFGGAGRLPDGGARFQSDEEKIVEQIRNGAARLGVPAGEVEKMIEARADGLAHFWVREGEREAVRTSPDVGPHGGRAQRVEVRAAGQGIAQWTHLPLHRVRRFRWRVVARSNQISALQIALIPEGATVPLATAEVRGLSARWAAFTGEITLEPSAPAEAIYRLTLTALAPGQFVVARVLLEPADAVHGADPDVVRLLRESRLPILRWPGGNFASSYHWEDGIGPPDARPTRPNYAWGGVEPNLFGTDEFIQFCRDVGCEPLICINAGDGTPEEAARWVEYCNGPADSPQGARRAANGHSEPYRVRYWEIGNEIYGRHQRFWTTAAGYADRYRQFVQAMRAVDTDIQFIACGCAPLVAWRGEDWNGRLLAENAALVRSISDHVLIGGALPAATDPLDVFRDSMAFPLAHEQAYIRLRDQMRAAGIAEPRLAITEMQLFQGPKPPEPGEAVRLTRENIVTPATMAEAIYDTLFYHLGVRLVPFIEMITHSATVNHGGGLRKERERVYPNPCHHAQAMFAAFAGATPVAVELAAGVEEPPCVSPRGETMGLRGAAFGVVDAVAAVALDDALLVSLAHRGTNASVRVEVEICNFPTAGTFEMRLLHADSPWDANTLAAPNRVMPVDTKGELSGNHLTLDLPLYSVALVRIPARTCPAPGTASRLKISQCLC